MKALGDRLDAIAKRRKTLEVYTDAEATAAELARQFDTRNVEVTRTAYPAGTDGEFVVVRNADGETQGALGVEQFQKMIAPDIHPPWELDEAGTDLTEVFDFLENTLFTSFDRRQMLAASREIEERAWRVGQGQLYAGFQNSRAVAAQTPVYNRFARERAVAIHVFIEDEVGETVDETIGVVSQAGAEIGQFWFVLFDGAGSDQSKCGLLAEERAPGQFYGFWTYEPEIVDETVDYLRETYGVSSDSVDGQRR